MRAFIFNPATMRMNSEQDEESGESSTDSPPPSGQTPRGKLRDLPPEKDPMGAGNPNAPRP